MIVYAMRMGQSFRTLQLFDRLRLGQGAAERPAGIRLNEWLTSAEYADAGDCAGTRQPLSEDAMTTLDVKLNLPDQIAQEAQRAGLLNGHAIGRLIEEAMQRLREANLPPLTEQDIAEEVKAARAARKGS
jgi:hypothetical protein